MTGEAAEAITAIAAYDFHDRPLTPGEQQAIRGLLTALAAYPGMVSSPARVLS